MAWTPSSDKVAPTEHLGRRLFDEPMLTGATDQRHFGGLDLRNFEETRGDDFSVDRLGRTSIDKKVVRLLKPLADAAGGTFHARRRFDGWAVVPARHLERKVKGISLSVKPSPESENPYHAHVPTGDLLAEIPEQARYYHKALHLKAIFTGTGSTVHTVPQNEVSLSPSLPSKIWNWVMGRFKQTKDVGT